MRTCDLHRRRHLLATLLTLTCLALSAHWASGQAYTQTSQTRSMRAEVTARVPGRPDLTDVQSEESMELGSFDRSISAFAAANDGAAADSIEGTATQRVTYNPDSISALLAAATETYEVAGRAGGEVKSYFRTEFRINEASDVPFSFTGTMRSTSGSSKGLFVVVDQDTEDPHGGGTVLFFQSLSPIGMPDPVEVSGTFLAGHRYSISAEVIADPPLLNDPAPPGGIQRSTDAEVGFTLSIPEPSYLWIASLFAILLAIGRRRPCSR